MARTKEPLRIGARVRALRNEAGLTQAEIAEAAGITPESMSRIERGRLSPSTDLVTRLAAAIGVVPGALFERGPAALKKPTLRAVDRRLLQVVRDLPEPQVEDVVRGLRLLIEVGRHVAERPRRGR